jgi:hypothetical protein
MTAILDLSVLSTEYVLIPVQALVDGVATDPTIYPVQFAFTAIGVDPSGLDWVDAGWQGGTTNGLYIAQCLVGPAGTITLTPGLWAIWIKVTSNPEIPVMQPGLLQIVVGR